MLQIAQTKTKATHTHKTHTHKVTLSLFELLVATKNKTTSIHTSIHAYNVTSSHQLTGDDHMISTYMQHTQG